VTPRRAATPASATSHQLWGGRFAGGSHPALVAVNRSIGVDIRLWPYDVELSKAWATAIGEAGVLTGAEVRKMRAGLDRVHRKLAAGVEPTASDEDVHTLVDRLLHDEIGAVASRLHTGRSRNDQVATGSRMLVMRELADILGAAKAVQKSLYDRARTVGDALMPAYTHLQRAQPVLAAHWLLAHFWAIERDRRRLTDARRSAGVLPLGSGAIAGSAFRVNRKRLARTLGFHSISPNSIDAVGDRDFMLDAVYALSTLGTHLSRLAEDLILFGSAEFGFVRFGDAFSTGSSMMPQKRNPDALELARGSAARVTGHLVSLLTMLKGTPSGYNKDFQDDKRALFDALDAMHLLLPAVAGTVHTLRFNTSRMRDAVTGSMMATDLADHLVRKRATFREAHAAVGSLVRSAEERNLELNELEPSEILDAHRLFDKSVMRDLDPAITISHRELDGGTGPGAVARQLAAARRTLRT